MTTEQEAPARRRRRRPAAPVPAAAVPLSQGALSCRVCGVEVRLGATVEVEVAALAREGEPSPAGQARRLPTFTFGRCPACTQRAARAQALLLAHPSIAGRQGNVAAHRLACALDGLAALGADLGALPDDSEALLVALMEHLAGPGSSVLWVSRFAPTWHSGADPDECNPQPWSHVGDNLRDRLSSAYAQVLAARVALSAPPVRLGPPDGAGCLCCGVRTAEMRRGAPSPWAFVTFSAGALGAASDPGRQVDGYLEPVCAAAIAHVGAIGPTALERALLAHRTPALLRELGADNIEISGLTAWAVSGLPPSDVPFSFVPEY